MNRKYMQLMVLSWIVAGCSLSRTASMSATAVTENPLPALTSTKTTQIETTTPTRIIPTDTLAPSPSPTFTPPPTFTPTPTLEMPLFDGTPLPSVEDTSLSFGEQLALWGRGRIEDIAWSPDGRLFAVCTQAGIQLYDNAGVVARSFIDTGDYVSGGGISTCAFSPKGDLIATGTSWTNQVHLWSVPDGAHVGVLDGGLPPGWSVTIGDVAFSPDGKVLASVSSEEGLIRLWRVSDGKLLQTLKGHTWWVYGVAFSPDGTMVATASGDKTVRVWRVSDGVLMHILNGVREMFCVDFSPDGKRIAAGGYDFKVRIWDAKEGNPQWALMGHDNSVLSVDFSPDGTRLASGSWDGTVRLWDVEAGKMIREIDGSKSWGLADGVEFSPDGKIVAAYYYGDQTVRWWRVSDGEIVHTLDNYTDSIFAVAISPDKELVASAGIDEVVYLRKVADGSVVRVLGGHEDWINGLDFSPTGTLLASGADDGIRIWRVRDGSLLNTIESYGVNDVAFSPDGTMLASNSWNDVVLLDVDTGEIIKTLEGHSDEVTSLDFSPDGRLLASGAGDGPVGVWKVSDGSLLFALLEHTDYVHDVAFSPDGTLLATGGNDDVVLLWRMDDGSLFQTLQVERVGEYGGVGSLTFVSDDILAIGTQDGTLEIWNVRSGERLDTFVGHTDNIYSLVSSNDGKLLISGAVDGTVRVWSALRYKESYVTDFSDLEKWSVVKYNEGQEGYVSEYKYGGLHVTIPEDDALWLYYTDPRFSDVRDVRMEVETELVADGNANKNDGGYVELQCRSSEIGEYAFLIDMAARRWEIGKWKASGEQNEWEYEMLAGRFSPHIKPTKNHMVVECSEKMLTLWINGEKMEAIVDEDILPAGEIGVGVETFNSPSEVIFRDFKVFTPVMP